MPVTLSGEIDGVLGFGSEPQRTPRPFDATNYLGTCIDSVHGLGELHEHPL